MNFPFDILKSDKPIPNYRLYRWLILEKRNSSFLGYLLDIASFILPLVLLCPPYFLYLVLPRKKELIFALAWNVSLFVFVWSGKVTFELYGFLNRYAVVKLANDQRPPIIYLRSFVDDDLYRDFESKELNIPSVADKFGPVIALGQPGKMLPPIGAARIYVSPDDDWQRTVSDFCRKCQFVIISPDFTPGVVWEILTAFEICGPTRVVFAFFNFEHKGERVYERFRNSILDKSKERNFPVHLPEKLPFSSFLHFDSNWQPHLIEETSNLDEPLRKSKLEKILEEKGVSQKSVSNMHDVLQLLNECYLVTLIFLFSTTPFIYFFWRFGIVASIGLVAIIVGISLYYWILDKF